MEIVLGKGSCPHVYTVGGNTFVSYSLRGEIYVLNVATKERRKICYGDEYLPIGNGRYLLRNGQNYFITEEI